MGTEWALASWRVESSRRAPDGACPSRSPHWRVACVDARSYISRVCDFETAAAAGSSPEVSCGGIVSGHFLGRLTRHSPLFAFTVASQEGLCAQALATQKSLTRHSPHTHGGQLFLMRICSDELNFQAASGTPMEAKRAHSGLRRSPWGTSQRSASSNSPCTASANAAAGTAPSRISPISSSRMPVRIGCP